MHRLLALASVLAIAATAPVYNFAKNIHFRTGDAVVVGALKNLSYESTGEPDDLLGHGFMTARLHVIRIERGRLPSSDIAVKYFGHTYMQEGLLFRFHLRPSKEGVYLLCFDGREGYRCP